MSSIPMPFFATRGATLYTERVRAEKDTFNREFGIDSNPVEEGKYYLQSKSYFRFSKISSNFILFFISVSKIRHSQIQR